MIVYLESSAAVKLIHDEVEGAALRRFLDQLSEDDELVGSALVETELRRAGVRLGVDQAFVSRVLGGVSLLAMPRSLFTLAGLLPSPILRSLDALHVASAVRAEADVVVAYDRRVLDAAAVAGLSVASPS